MLKKTNSIALHTIRYGESSIIAYLYTQDYGRCTIMVNGAYGKGRNRGKVILFHPLNLLRLVFYRSNRQAMGRLSEAAPYQNLFSITQNPVKRTIALFIGEVIYRCVREEEPNPQLYNFLETSIQVLELMDRGLANFHLVFLVQLSRHLGFFPHGSYSKQTPYFDAKKGYFVNRTPAHPFAFTTENSHLLSTIQDISYHYSHKLNLNRYKRNSFLESILAFYAFHLDLSQPIKSIQVLKEIFDD